LNALFIQLFLLITLGLKHYLVITAENAFTKEGAEMMYANANDGDSGKTDRPFRSSGTLNPLETEQYFSPELSAPGRWGCAPAA